LSDDFLDSWCGENPTEAQEQFRSNWTGFGKNRHILDLSIIDFGFAELAKGKAHTQAQGNDDIDVLMKCLEHGWTRLQRKKSRGWVN
jgi:hypothetical protein